MNPRILLVDDEPDVLKSLELTLSRRYEVSTALTVDDAQEMLSAQEIDVVVTDLNFHGQTKDGLALVDWLANQFPNMPVIILSGEVDVHRVISAQRRITEDYLVKPVDISQLMIAIEKALRHGQERKLKKPKQIHSVITQDAHIKRALTRISKVIESNTSLNILILGESGTGKEEIAKYAASVRGGPFVAVNMAALPRDLGESELFGHVRGAFTGAQSDKTGKFQAADGGILFLDEIGDCRLDIQVKLLRVLQEREVVRVGSNRPEPIDVKVVAATNQDLWALVKEGKFREELLYRLEGLVINIPPLRDRREDIPLLVGKFLSDFSPKSQVATISTEALQALVHYPWPGNVRELVNTVQQSLVASGAREIGIHHLPLKITDNTKAPKRPAKAKNSQDDFEPMSLELALQFAELRAFRRAIDAANGSRKKAIELLGITESMFYRRCRDLGLLHQERAQ